MYEIIHKPYHGFAVYRNGRMVSRSYHDDYSDAEDELADLSNGCFDE